MSFYSVAFNLKCRWQQHEKSFDEPLMMPSQTGSFLPAEGDLRDSSRTKLKMSSTSLWATGGHCPNEHWNSSTARNCYDLPRTFYETAEIRGTVFATLIGLFTNSGRLQNCLQRMYALASYCCNNWGCTINRIFIAITILAATIKWAWSSAILTSKMRALLHIKSSASVEFLN